MSRYGPYYRRHRGNHHSSSSSSSASFFDSNGSPTTGEHFAHLLTPNQSTAAAAAASSAAAAADQSNPSRITNAPSKNGRTGKSVCDFFFLNHFLLSFIVAVFSLFLTLCARRKKAIEKKNKRIFSRYQCWHRFLQDEEPSHIAF